MQQQLSSALLEDAVRELSTLPGIGRKTALNLNLFLLKRSIEEVERLASALSNLRNNVKYCNVCYNICDNDTCEICINPSRDTTTICVVQTIKDLMILEDTRQFNGLYHVLGGVLSPVDGIGLADLTIEELIKRVSAGGVKEVILALSTTMDAETTNFIISRKLEKYDVKITILSRGIALGEELEYADDVTLGSSLASRVSYNTRKE